MDIRAENLKKIKDLEEEFSDDKIAEIFRDPAENGAHVSGRQGRPTLRFVLKRMAVIAVIVIVFVVLLQFFSPKVVNEETLGGALLPNDCLVIAVHAYDFNEIEVGDLVFYEDGDGTGHYGQVIGLSGGVVEIEGGEIESEQVAGKALFRLFPVSRGGKISVI